MAGRLPRLPTCCFAALLAYTQLIASAALPPLYQPTWAPCLYISGLLTTALGGVQMHASWVAMARQAHRHPSAGSGFGRGSLPVDEMWAALVSARPSSQLPSSQLAHSSRHFGDMVRAPARATSLWPNLLCCCPGLPCCCASSMHIVYQSTIRAELAYPLSPASPVW